MCRKVSGFACNSVTLTAAGFSEIDQTSGQPLHSLAIALASREFGFSSERVTSRGCRASVDGRQSCGCLLCWYSGVFWLSCCFPMKFFRSGLNFVLCLHSGVGKGGLGYFSCPLVPSLASRPRIWSCRSGALLFGKPDAISTHPALRAPFLICILQAPAFHATHLAFSWPQTHLVHLSFPASEVKAP